MVKKDNKDTNDEIHDLLREMMIQEQGRKEAYSAFVESIKDLHPLEKAEVWLDYVSNNIENYSDQEALIYRLSRGKESSNQINELIKSWKIAAQKELGKAEKWPINQNRSLVHTSRFALPDFWGGYDYQEFTIDSTMLRTVEWAEIAGFDDWWKRLAKNAKEEIMCGGVKPVPICYWLFNMCRSKYAIQLMGQTLVRCLEALNISSEGGNYPWNIFYNLDKQPKLVDHIPYACTIVFSSLILNDQINEDLIQQALETIISCQDSSGGWPCWSGDTPGIESTAMAIHAVALGKPRGWERVVRDASDWLWSQQEEDGPWTDPAMPDPVFLTVLVLDALELAKGENRVTCPITTTTNLMGVHSIQHNHRFLVALSFAGENRDYVEKVAVQLTKYLGKDTVFYDKFFEGELARPNLDIYLQSIYHEQSKLIVVFLCDKYEEKIWCGLEWRAIRDLINKREKDIMPLRFDDVNISGLFSSIDGYIDLRNRDPREISIAILQRLGD